MMDSVILDWLCLLGTKETNICFKASESNQGYEKLQEQDPGEQDKLGEVDPPFGTGFPINVGRQAGQHKK